MVSSCRKSRWPVSLMVLMASTCLAGVAMAQDSGTSSPPVLAQAQESMVFDIPAQPLAGAVTAFGRQSGFQVSVDQATLANLRSAAVSGRMTPEDAMRQMLAGTGITWRFAGGRSIYLTKVPDGQQSGALQLDPVQVQGFPVPQQAMIDNLPAPYAGGQVATGGQLGLLGNRDVMDTPFNQSNYTSKKAQEQQAKTVQDVLVDDPSVRTIRADTSPGTDGMRIRGFPVDNAAVAYGGLYGVLPTYSIMAEVAERVEVLKGPSAMLNGMAPTSEIGGTINIVPKRAPDQGLTQFTANYISGAQFGGHADVARRFGTDKQFGVRFNGVYRNGQTDVRWNTDQRALALLGLDFRGERVRFSADVGYQQRYIGGVTGYIWLTAGTPLPWAPNVKSNPAGQPWAYSQNKDLFGTFRGELDITDNVTAYVSLGMHDQRVEGMIQSSANLIRGANGGANGQMNNSSDYGLYRTAEAGLRATARTGPIDHQLSFTATSYNAEFGSAFVVGAPFATNIYNPTIIARPNIPTPAANKTSTSDMTSIGFADTLSAADKRVQLTVGGRFQRVAAANFDPITGLQDSTYDQSAFSPSVALVVKPWQNVSIYGNWIQGLQQGVIVGPQYQNSGQVFAPYKSTQFEAGVKVDWGGKFTTTVSAFQIARPSTIAVPGATLPTLTLDGEQVNQGLEFNVFGEPIEGVRLLGGMMFLNPVLTKTQGGATDGWIAPFSPTFQFNLAGEWDLPWVPGLTVNGRAIYTGAQYVDTTWPRRMVPDWTRFDLGARYAFENPGAKGKLLVARFNVENLLDTNYWAGGNNAFTLNLGAPRTFRLSLTADF